MRYYDFSIGAWCLVSGGGDPFGIATRAWELEAGLAGCAEAGIKKISFHDRDLYDDDASEGTIIDVLNSVKEQLKRYRLQVYNFTTNLFSNPCFRSGAFSSPYPDVVQAAIVKGCKSMDAAYVLGAKYIIFWGGREGQDGCYEQDAGRGWMKYLLGIKACVDYAIAKGYDFKYTIETKLYEPRLLGSYAGTGSSAAAGIMKVFSDPKYQGRIFINPEYPQHVSMLGMDPVFELGELLELGLLAPFIHFGGQIPARMDCDLAPGIGSVLASDFMICLMLKERSWDGVIEFDCRPVRTTTTVEGLKLFLLHCVDYWRMLEDKVKIYQADPIIANIRVALDKSYSAELEDVFQASECDGNIVAAVASLAKKTPTFEDVAKINTDANEAHAYRIGQILTGMQKRGTKMFDGTPWAA
ncbi:MAG: hypothetical protein PHN39_00575 [Candidatus Pacebacteria bacterium]|nr:hypothetical protein [Candidatus Paceibacterota bacterium]